LTLTEAAFLLLHQSNQDLVENEQVPTLVSALLIFWINLKTPDRT